MDNLTKAGKFFRPYLSSSIQAYKKNNIAFSLSREILSDNLPVDDKFIKDYIDTFPERLYTKILDTAVDSTLREIIHDVILRHACEYLATELKTGS